MPRSAAFILLFMLILPGTITLSYTSSSLQTDNDSWEDHRILYAPAVSRQGGGALIEINLTIKYPGSGKVYFNANPLVETDTQATARIAAYVAATITGKDFYRYDYYVDMTSNSIIVGGPSAGGLMTIGFISIFLNKTINSWVTMTGMINPDGSIGPIGGLPDKLRAVANAGFKVFLIPLGQRTVIVEKKVVKRFLWGYYETIEYQPVDIVEMGRSLGVTVVEVGNIMEAMKYFMNITYGPGNASARAPQELYEKVKDVVEANLLEIDRILNDTRTRYDSLGYFEKWNAASMVNRVFAEEKKLRQLVGEQRFYAALDYSYRVIRDAYQANLEVRLLSGETLQEITHSVNNTLHTLYSQLLNESVSNESIASIIISKDSYLCLRKFMEGLNAANKNDAEESIQRYSASLAILWRAIRIAGFSSLNEVKVHVDPRKILLFYSLADATISYAYSLVNDVGRSNYYITQAMDFFEYAGDALGSNDTSAAIGLLIDTIVSSDIGIETLFIDNQTVLMKIAEYIGEEALVYTDRVGMDSPLNLYVLIAGEEKEIGDPVSSMYNILTYIYLASLTGGRPQGSFMNITPSFPLNGGREPVVNPVGQPGIPGRRDLTFMGIGLIVGLVMGIIIARVVRMGKKEGILTYYWPV